MSCMRMYLQIHVVIDTFIPVLYLPTSADSKRERVREERLQHRGPRPTTTRNNQQQEQQLGRTATTTTTTANIITRGAAQVGQIFSRIPAAMRTTSTMTTTTATTTTVYFHRGIAGNVSNLFLKVTWVAALVR